VSIVVQTVSSLRTYGLGLAVLVAVATSVRADVAGSSQQLGALAGSTQTAPAISGTGAVWTNYDGAQFDIYYQDVVSGAPTNLTKTPGDNEFLEDIDKGFVVYTHTGGPTNAPGDILMLDTSTGKIANVATSDTTVHFAHPAMGGNYVVFERITTQYDIDVYDRTLGGSPGPQVTNDAAMQLHPRVSGDCVVYEDYARNGPAGPADVYGYHVLSSGPNFLIAQNARLPDVDGNNVVFVGADATGGDQLFLYDLTTAATRQLTTAVSNKATPRISGSRLIWTDNRRGTDDVWSLDLSTGVEDILAGGPGSQTVGDVSDTRAVYSSTDATGANDSVWLFTFAGGSIDPLPVGCDPAKTNLVQGPVPLHETTRRPVWAHRKFTSVPGKTYYICVDNGKPDGSERSSHVVAAVDGHLALTPADFQPANNPPKHVAAKLDLDRARGDDDDCEEEHHERGDRGSNHVRAHGFDEGGHHCSNGHHWDAALFAQPGTSIAVSIRVAK
jgi:beta propeller repeat protein